MSNYAAGRAGCGAGCPADRARALDGMVVRLDAAKACGAEVACWTGKLADALIIGTQDTMHFEQCSRALDLGYDHLDTANIYGAGKNEELIGAAISHRRDEY